MAGGVGGVRGNDGRLWVATGLGMTVIDPRSLPPTPAAAAAAHRERDRGRPHRHAGSRSRAAIGHVDAAHRVRDRQSHVGGEAALPLHARGRGRRVGVCGERRARPPTPACRRAITSSGSARPPTASGRKRRAGSSPCRRRSIARRASSRSSARHGAAPRGGVVCSGCAPSAISTPSCLRSGRGSVGRFTTRCCRAWRRSVSSSKPSPPSWIRRSRRRATALRRLRRQVGHCLREARESILELRNNSMKPARSWTRCASWPRTRRNQRASVTEFSTDRAAAVVVGRYRHAAAADRAGVGQQRRASRTATQVRITLIFEDDRSVLTRHRRRPRLRAGRSRSGARRPASTSDCSPCASAPHASAGASTSSAALATARRSRRRCR